jgi:coenzyme F420-reducing hydrogenase beta subunit
MSGDQQAISVCDQIVPGGFCSGCGVCAGVCREAAGAAALTMCWNEAGTYEPVIDANACLECSTCLEVCPFVNENLDTDELASNLFGGEGCMPDPVLGRHMGLYGGYSRVRGHRENGAGGGMATWFLETLLERGLVDRVACVLPGSGPDKLFRFVVADNAEVVRTGSKSAYYPVEVSDVVSEIFRTDARFAVVGLPCVIRGLRLAARKLTVMGERLVFTLGLTCGQGRSRYFAEFLCAKCGGDPAAMDRVRFRVKDARRHHLDHRFECSGAGFSGSIYQTDGMGWLWGHDCFKMGACNYCDDITAELADVTFADAIDEPYCHGNAGANFIIARSKLALEILAWGKDKGELELEPVPLEAVRHRMEGVELVKRRDFRHRLHLRASNGEYVPTGRQQAEARDNEAENEWMSLRDRLREVSTAAYASGRHEPDVIDRVQAVIDVILGEHGDGAQ